MTGGGTVAGKASVVTGSADCGGVGGGAVRTEVGRGTRTGVVYAFYGKKKKELNSRG